MSLDPQKVRSIFLTAVENHTPDQWSAYLDDACGGDQDLRRRVELLLRAHEQPKSLRGARESQVNEIPGTMDEPIREGPGTLIGPYKLLEQIGEGGMGAVFMAEQTEPVKRLVALKIIKPGMDTRQVIARFEAERQALALMDHPNIAKVHDGGETASGLPYFVMELVKGVPITEFCDQNQLPVRQRLDLFLHVCQAVQHAHQKGVIHRDLKPSNILVALYDDKPVPKVIDFGVAKATGPKLSERTMFTQFGHLVGTPEYMSPEQATFNSLDIDTRSDIYSLGVLLYELLTGSTPLEKKRLRETPFDETLRLIREEEPPKPSTRLSESKGTLMTIAADRQTEPTKLSRSVRGDLDWIVMKALEKDRDRRYETASAFAMDLRHYLADEPVLACPPSAGYRFRKFIRRNRVPLAFTGLILLFVVALAGGIAWMLGERSFRHREAEAKVREALDISAAVLRQGKPWDPALIAAVERAKSHLTNVEDDPLTRQVDDMIRDLEMARALEDTRLRLTPDRDGDFDYAGADAAFATAFAAYGLDVNLLSPQAAAEQIRLRPIHWLLVNALNDWAYTRKKLQRSGWRERYAAARAADPEALRDRLKLEDRVRALEDTVRVRFKSEDYVVEFDGKGNPVQKGNRLFFPLERNIDLELKATYGRKVLAAWAIKTDTRRGNSFLLCCAHINENKVILNVAGFQAQSFPVKLHVVYQE